MLQYIDKMLRKVMKPFFPVKHTPLYGQYMGWSFLSNIIGSIEDCISTHCMLSSLSTQTTDLSVSYNYIGKNMIGQLGGLWYINKIGTNIDTNPRKYFRQSLLINQTAICLECLIPLGAHFLLFAGSASILKSIAWTGYGAVTTKILISLSDNNSAEIYSKLCITNTIASSIGMLMGLYIVYLVPCHTSRMLFIPVLTAGRIYTMHRAIHNIL